MIPDKLAKFGEKFLLIEVRCLSYELADGSEIRIDITTGDIEFMGEIVGGTIIFGDPGIEPILGVTALESVGIDIDPRNQKLKRMPSTRLKKLKPKI